MFVEEVLARVPDLDPAAVEPQTPLQDAHGRQRRIDFTIREGEHVRIALDVDGYDKTGRGTGMTAGEFIEWSVREQAITALGNYRVLRFANSLVKHQPENCARNIELTLSRDRAVAERLERAEHERDQLTERLAASQAELGRLGHELVAAERAGDQAKVEQAREKINQASDRAPGAELLSKERQEELMRLEMGRRTTAQQADEELRVELTRSRRENQRMKTVVISAAVIVVAVVVLVLALSGGDDPATTANEACPPGIDWSEAKAHVDTTQTVRGPVEGATFASSTRSQPTYLNVGKPFPEPDRFSVVIFGEDRSNFRRPPEDTYEGKQIAVSGEVGEFRGVPQVIVNHPNDIAVCS